MLLVISGQLILMLSSMSHGTSLGFAELLCRRQMIETTYLTEFSEREAWEKAFVGMLKNDPQFFEWLRVNESMLKPKMQENDFLWILDRYQKVPKDALPHSDFKSRRDRSESSMSALYADHVKRHEQWLEEDIRITKDEIWNWQQKEWSLPGLPRDIPNPKFKWNALDAYDRAVLFLRKGDTVRYKSGTYVLGEFLGSGNATHVWAIEGDPNKVIRIPFLSFHLRDKLGGRDAGPSELVNAWLAGFKKTKTRKVKKYFPKDHTKSLVDHIIVQRVQGVENGLWFFRKMSNPDRPYASELLDEWEALKKAGDKKTAKKLEKLARKLDKTRAGARQFIWDTEIEDWIQVDFEGD